MSVIKIAFVLVLIPLASSSSWSLFDDDDDDIIIADDYYNYDLGDQNRELLTRRGTATGRSLDETAARSLSRAQEEAECGLHHARTNRRSISQQSGRIAGGYIAQPGEFPSFVQVRSSFRSAPTNTSAQPSSPGRQAAEGDVELKSIQSCGGTIISDRLILTAAHCVTHAQGYPLHDVFVMAGSVNLRGDFKRLQVENVCLTEDAGFNKFDVAVLITSEPIQFDENIQPACVPGTDLSFDAEAFVVGMGFTTNTPAPTPAKQLQVLPVRRLKNCRSNMDRDHIMCLVSRDPKFVGDICSGDSGGPTYVLDDDGSQTVVGIVSGSTNRCVAGKSTSSVHENVFVAYDRIKHMVEQCQPHIPSS